MGILTLAIAIGVRVFWGKITQKIIYDKGYNDNWFWWGFFFTWIAVIVAAVKSPVAPAMPYRPGEYAYLYNGGNNPPDNESLLQKQQKEGYWKCSCGRVNPPYLTTCDCGKTPQQLKCESEQMGMSDAEAAEQKNLRLMKEYKDLLDSGVINREEFDRKKAELFKN